jgi:hypothetical protein
MFPDVPAIVLVSLLLALEAAVANAVTPVVKLVLVVGDISLFIVCVCSKVSKHNR